MQMLLFAGKIVITLFVGLVLLAAIIQTVQNLRDLFEHKFLNCSDEDGEAFLFWGTDDKDIVGFLLGHFCVTLIFAALFMYLMGGFAS